MKSDRENVQRIASALKSVKEAEENLRTAKESAARSVLNTLQSRSGSNSHLPRAIDMEDGTVLTIADEWWQYKSVLDAIRLIDAPTKLSDLQ